jgi:hypothetical protein
MTSADTKNCRHCGEPILAIARVCKHCLSNQGWYASQRDPRYLLLVVPIVLLFVAVPLVVISFIEKIPDRAISQNDTCRGLVTGRSTSYDVRTIDEHDHLFVRVQVENRSKVDISDPVIRVEIVDGNGAVKDTFIRTVYGANIPPSQPYLLRVEGDTTVDRSSIKEVRAQVVGAACRRASQ